LLADTGVYIATFPLQGVLHVEGPEMITLTCATGVDHSTVLDARIAAIRVGE
jgi:hypothetical protein